MSADRTANAEPRGTLDVALSHGYALLAAEPKLAAEQAAEILKLYPKNARALLLLGAAKRRTGEPADAVLALEKSLALSPFSVEALIERGLAEAACGESGRALKSIAHALSIDSSIVNAWRMLADELLQAGDEEAAGKAFARHVTASAKDPELLQAAADLNENRLAPAERRLKSYLRRTPTDVAAIRMLAELAARIGRYQDSEILLERCLALAPEFRAARHNLAIVQLRQGKAAEAAAETERLLADNPKDPGYRTLYCAALVRLGEYEKALGQYEALLQKHPHQPKTWMSFGHALKTVGRQAEAIDAYRKSIRLLPSLGEAYWSLANLKTYRFTDDDVAIMKAQIGRDDISEEDRLHLHFALGKAFEDERAFEESFLHYEKGNAIRQAQIGYDEETMAARIEAIKSVFTKQLIDSRAGAGFPAKDPIFILGMPRAGSTLIEQILSSHSLIEGTMELPDIIALARGLGGKQGDAARYPTITPELSRDTLRALGEEYLERTRIQRKTAKPYFIDKMPNNFMHAGFIRMILPNAKIIDARRHPMACCFSNFKQHFAKGQGFSYGQERIARYYRDYVGLMKHFDAAMPGVVHRVIHEKLVQDFESEVRRLLSFIGVPFETACLRFHETERPVRTASSEQVRRPIFTEGLDYWRNYEPWLGPMKAILGDVLEAYPDVP
jgi:tetratricopeptide (TPR) repeat protein